MAEPWGPCRHQMLQPTCWQPLPGGHGAPSRPLDEVGTAATWQQQSLKNSYCRPEPAVALPAWPQARLSPLVFLSLSLIHTYTSCSCPPSSTSQPHGDPTSHASSPKPTPALPRAGPPSWAHSFIMLPRPHPRPELRGDFLSPKPASNSPLWDRVLVPSPLVYMFQSWAGLGCPQLVPAEAGCVELPS